MTPLRVALWERDRQGHPVGPDQLSQHWTSAPSTRRSGSLSTTGPKRRPWNGSVGDAHDNDLMESINGLCIPRVRPQDGIPREPAQIDRGRVEFATAG